MRNRLKIFILLFLILLLPACATEQQGGSYRVGENYYYFSEEEYSWDLLTTSLDDCVTAIEGSMRHEAANEASMYKTPESAIDLALRTSEFCSAKFKKHKNFHKVEIVHLWARNTKWGLNIFKRKSPKIIQASYEDMCLLYRDIKRKQIDMSNLSKKELFPDESDRTLLYKVGEKCKR